MSTMGKKILKNRALQHLAFWGLAFYLLLRNFATSSEVLPVDAIYTAIFLLFIWLTVYVNLLILIPRFFQQGRYGRYAVWLTVSLLAGVEGYHYGFDTLVDGLFPGYYLISYFEFWDTLKYFVIFTGLTSLFHFSKSWFWYRAAEVQLASNEKARIAAELEALKSQVNPHFLFNSLNSIYSLVLKKSEAAAPALIRLSDILRYVIYETSDFVPLAREVDFVKNYIDMQRLRLRHQEALIFEVSGEMEHKQIAPLLLIPIVENCFKHGLSDPAGKTKVHIRLEVHENVLRLQTANGLSDQQIDLPETASGSGLENLKRRLELVYPQRHHLKIEISDATFNVELTLEL